jgi:hypothetical protein
MNRYFLVFMLIGMGATLVLFFLVDVPEPLASDEPAQPLEGRLYSNAVEEMEKSESSLSGLPQVTVPGEDVRRLGLGEAKEILLKVVPDSSAQYRLLPKETGHKKDGEKGRVEKSSGTLKVDIPASSDPEYSFKFFDTILKKSESSYVLNNRFIKGGITFEAMMICRWKDLYLLKFRITNDEEREFFVAKVDVQADGRTLITMSYPPFSCRSFRTVEGIVTFPVSDVKNRKVSLILIEGGERGRAYPIASVDYAF